MNIIKNLNIILKRIMRIVIMVQDQF